MIVSEEHMENKMNIFITRGDAAQTAGENSNGDIDVKSISACKRSPLAEEKGLADNVMTVTLSGEYSEDRMALKEVRIMLTPHLYKQIKHVVDVVVDEEHRVDEAKAEAEAEKI